MKVRKEFKMVKFRHNNSTTGTTVTKHGAKKTYGGVEIKIHKCLILDGDELSVQCTGTVNQIKSSPTINHCALAETEPATSVLGASLKSCPLPPPQSFRL
jgi:hypothetical protein